MKKDIYKIQLESNHPAIEPVNLFFLPNRDKLVMIDSGDGMSSSVKGLSDKLDNLGFKLEDISIIINTHEHIEHFGGNAAIKEISSAKILAHRLATPFIEDMGRQIPPDIELKDLPEEITLFIRGRSMMYNNLRTTNVDLRLDGNRSIHIGNYSLKIIHTPGHTKGHICIYEENKRILFAGDLLMEKGTPYIGRLPGQYGDMIDYLKSLQRLKGLKIERLLQSHGAEISDPYKKIEDTIQSKLTREREILQLLNEGRKTISEIIYTIYGESNYFTYGTVLAYLDKLEKENKIKRDDKIFFVSR